MNIFKEKKKKEASGLQASSQMLGLSAKAGAGKVVDGVYVPAHLTVPLVGRVSHQLPPIPSTLALRGMVSLLFSQIAFSNTCHGPS